LLTIDTIELAALVEVSHFIQRLSLQFHGQCLCIRNAANPTAHDQDFKNRYISGSKYLYLCAVDNRTIRKARWARQYEYLLRLKQNLWAVPATRLIGKRYTIIGSLLLFTVANIWTAVAGTYGSVMASRIVGGMFGGVIESLGPPMVEELFDRHELGRAMQIYVMGLGLGSVLGPIMAGFITNNTGNWRNFFWLTGGLVALNFVMSIFMLPETSYPPTSGERPAASAAGSTSSIAQRYGKGNVEEGGQEIEEVTFPVTDQNQPTWMEVWMKNSFFLSHPHVHHPKSWLLLILDPFRLLLVPAVAGVCLLFGTHIAWAVTVSVNVADHYGGPPFFWPTSHLGLINLAARKAIKNRTQD
jgi:MFS family permease